MGAAVDRLGAISRSLNDVIEKVDTVSARLAGAQGELQRLAGSGTATAAVLAAQEAKITRSSTIIAQATSTLSEAVAGAVSQISAQTSKLEKKTATRLDDLQHLLSDQGNAWDVQVRQLIDAVELGIIPLSELLRLYGDAQIQGQRLSEFLGNLPIDEYTRRIDALIQSLSTGASDLEDIKKFLAQSNLEFGKQMLAAIDLFKQGKLTLQAVADLVAQIRKLFPDSQFADLATAVLHGLQAGDL